MVQLVRHSSIHCSLTFSLVIKLSFPKSRIKLDKQGYLIFWKSQGPLLILQALSKGNTFVRTWLSLAHKSNFADHVIITTGLRRMHFPHPSIFLRWTSNLAGWFRARFHMEQHSGTGCTCNEWRFSSFYVWSFTFFCTSQFTFLPFGNSSIIMIF